MGAPETTWQPIETAPKEGCFLVWLSEPELGSYVHTMRAGRGATIGTRFAHDCSGQPTHWMPLPPPPEAA
jgi:hypothetical protein